MLFKLVRTDTEEPSKIQLPSGTHVIGRGGKLLECDDKRISRNHGEVIVTHDTITIKALHKNPCFVMKKAKLNVEILKQNQTAELCNGDKFGLLPDTFWYEILHCPDLDNKNAETTRENETVNTENNGLQRVNTITESAADDNGLEETQMLENTCLGGSPSYTQRTDDEDGSPSLLTNPPSPPQNEESTEPADTVSQSQNNESLKRGHSSDSEAENVKRVKTEPADVKPDPDGANPGPSNDQGAAAAQPAPAPPLGRERCMYGASCYRKNCQHKAQFSHPNDSDWGGGDRGVCPWGATCARRHPRHWTTHDHPPGTLPPHAQPQNLPQRPQPGARAQRHPRPRRAPSSDSSGDTPDNGLIVTGKRTRKVIQRDPHSDSEEEEEDPFASDGSDEWQPGTDDRLDSQ